MVQIPGICLLQLARFECTSSSLQAEEPMKKVPVLIAAGFTLATLAACPSAAAACQCGQLPNTKESLASAQWVVAGEIESVRRRWIPLFSSEKQVTLIVERSWKGVPPSRLKLVIGRSNCDFEGFKKGAKYLVFVERAAGAWTASICKPNKLFQLARQELRILGPGIRIRSQEH